MPPKPNLNVTFLGTGTSHGIPVIGCSCEVCASSDPKDKRLRSSIMVEKGGVRLVVDTGPDFRAQMLREKVSMVEAVLMTHEHRDHIAGLDDIRVFNYYRQGDALDVYAVPRVQQAIRDSFAYIFEDQKYPGIPKVSLKDVTQSAFQLGDIRIQPIEVMHYRLPVVGYRFDDFCYITDVSHIPEEAYRYIEGSKALVISCLQIDPHISHFNLEQALEVAERLRIPQTYFIHMSHKLGRHEDITKLLPENVSLAYDGLKVSL